MAVRIDGNNDLINAADGTLTIEGISVNVVGVSTASGGYKVGTAYTVFPNGNVATAGIVTATKLDISTNPAGGLPVIGLKHVSSGNDTFQITGGITDRTNGGFAIRDVEESSNRFVIDSNGKVGIGSEVPSHKLSISDSSPGVVINREVDAVNQLNFRTLGIHRGSLGASSGSCLQVHDSSSIEKFRILQNGKVGINTNVPAHLLDISGNGVAFPSAAGSTLLRLRDSSGTTTLSIDSAAGSSSVIQFGDTSAASQGTILYNNNSDYFQFNTAGSDKARLDSSGNLGIGTNVFPVNGTNIKVSDGTIARFGLHKTGSNERNFEIGNGGTFLNVYDVTADVQRLRINSSGNLKLGTATADRDLGGLSVQRLHIEGTDGGSSAIGLVNNQNSTGQAAVYFSKSRGTSVGSNTILQDDDPMGALVFCGADGNDMISIGAQITASVNGTPGSNDMPGMLTFSVTADGAATATERLRIRSTGVLQVNTTTAPGGSPSGGGTANSGGFLHLMAANGENGMSLINASSISNSASKGEVLTGINFINRNYYTSSGRAGTGYVIRSEKGHSSYMDRCQLRLIPGYDGNTLYSNRSVVFDFDGHILPGDDDYANLGGGSYRWDNVYATNGSIQTSDENLKQNIQSLSTAEMNAAASISKLFITYKWKSKVAKEEAGGNAARIHTGIIAQRIKEALEAEGLTAANYSFWCENITWKDSEGNVAGDGRKNGVGVYDELTGTTPSTDGYTKSVDYAVRYTELLSFVSAYNEQRFTSIESRLDAAGL